MNEELDNIITFYHPLCDINHHHIENESKHSLVPRTSIKLLTYNIFLRPPPIKTNENDWKDERMSEFIKCMPNFDIICLQEMFGSFNSRKHDLISSAIKQGFFFYVDTPSPSFFSKYLVDGGLVILSRFPIINSSFIPFKYGVLSDSLAQKGVLYAKIEIKNSVMHLFTTHLQASYITSTEYNWNVSYKTRISQVEQTNCIINQLLIENRYNKNQRIILLGDFNCDAKKYIKKRDNLRITSEIENEYENMMQILNYNNNVVHDAFLKYKNMHPITYGDLDIETNLTETVLTSPEDRGSCFTLDYIFEYFISNEDEENSANKTLIINGESMKIEKFLISGFNFTQLSDHYGISVELNYKNPENHIDESIEDNDNLINY